MGDLEGHEVDIQSLRRGEDVVAAVLGMKPREKVRSENSWKKALAANMIDPNKNSSMFRLKAAGVEWIDEHISVERFPGMTDEEYQRGQEFKRMEYKRGFAAVVEASLHNWGQSLIAKLSQEHLVFTGQPMLPTEQTPTLRVREIDLGGDVLQIIHESATHSQSRELAIQTTVDVWNILRDRKNYPRPLTPRMVIREVYPTDEYRSAIWPTSEPWEVFNLNQLDVRGAAQHEAIHLAFIAQAGLPVSWDFTEGVAMRIGFGLSGKDVSGINRPLEYFQKIIDEAKLEPGDRVGSHTQLLEVASERSGAILKAGLQIKDVSYLYGFAFATAILESERYKTVVEQARKANEHPYSFLLKINHDLTADTLVKDGLLSKEADGGYSSTQKLSQRDVLQHVLEKNGFDANNIFEQAAYVLQGMRSGGR